MNVTFTTAGFKKEEKTHKIVVERQGPKTCMHLTPKGAVEFSSENPVSRFQKKEKFNGKHEAFERTRWLEMCFVDGGNKVTIAAEEGGHPGTWVKYRDTLLDGGILLFCKIVTFPDGVTRVSRTTRAIGGLA